jgi:hypothetical protein
MIILPNLYCGEFSKRMSWFGVKLKSRVQKVLARVTERKSRDRDV